jgi:exodeoxyribonuclease V alpha subunit
LETITGSLVHVIFRNEENGYTVARLKSDADNNQHMITGLMMGIQSGEKLTCRGTWKIDKKYGQQFAVEAFEVRLPDDSEGIEQYLASGQIAGIGEVFAKRIVDLFGTETFAIFDSNPEKLLEIDGIGKKKLERISSSWKEQQNARGIILFLQKFGIAAQFAQRIHKQYGNESIDKVTENPYRLADEMVGVGFKRADEFARHLGVDSDDFMRLDAGIIYHLNELCARGNSCFPLEAFIVEAAKMLEVDKELLNPRVGILVSKNKIQIENFKKGEDEVQLFIWPQYLYRQEVNIVEQVKRLLASNKLITSPKEDLTEIIAQKCIELGIQLAPQQIKAVEQSVLKKLNIITGGPGTGKSTITRVILSIFKSYGLKVSLAAPTGRAAKRLSEITSEEASTIHSMLSIDGFTDLLRSRLTEKLQCDVLIVDEASMIDTSLMSVLLNSLPDHAKLILIGDVDQLPSVGPGNVLKDLIQSGEISTTKLSEIFRQAQNSRIILNAHKINNGIFPDLSIDREGDFFFIGEKEPDKIASLIIGLVSERLKKTYNFHPLRDIQVLCPIHKGLIGTQELNAALQNALNNPEDKEKTQRLNTIFAVGDKVMQLKNNYEKEVFNGDIGYIKKVKTVDKQLLVQYDKELEILYEFSELNELELAYAVSVHKYQGSESPCIILPVHESQYMMLYRNLLYTAVTRGKKLVIIVGSKDALNIAIRNNNAKDRHSGLLRIFAKDQQRAFPEIKIIPMLGSDSYEEWLTENEHLF